MKKIKRANEKKILKDTEKQKAYEDYDWKLLQESGTLKKQRVAVLDFFLKKHNLFKRKIYKMRKFR